MSGPATILLFLVIMAVFALVLGYFALSQISHP